MNKLTIIIRQAIEPIGQERSNLGRKPTKLDSDRS